MSAPWARADLGLLKRGLAPRNGWVYTLHLARFDRASVGVASRALADRDSAQGNAAETAATDDSQPLQRYHGKSIV